MSRLLLLLLLFCSSAQAHQLRGVLVTVTEASGGQVTLAMKSSLNKDGRPASVHVALEPACERQAQAFAERLDDAVLRRWTLRCPDGLSGRALRLRGLDVTTPDAFVEVTFADGQQTRYGLSRHDPLILLEDEQGGAATGLWAYFGIGVEHILLGPDHLLFVLGLLLLLQLVGSGWRRIVGTVTAFTIAHSITLALAVVGGVTLPSTPVEIVIALSILLLAVEVARHPQRRERGMPASLSLRRPWLVAFGFGLLHGFGFAGALADIGVPEAAAGWALLLFNLGVEAGQLAFVLAVFLLFKLLRQQSQLPRLLPVFHSLLVHAIGGLAVFWVLQRSYPLFG